MEAFIGLIVGAFLVFAYLDISGKLKDGGKKDESSSMPSPEIRPSFDWTPEKKKTVKKWAYGIAGLAVIVGCFFLGSYSGSKKSSSDDRTLSFSASVGGNGQSPSANGSTALVNPIAPMPVDDGVVPDGTLAVVNTTGQVVSVFNALSGKKLADGIQPNITAYLPCRYNTINYRFVGDGGFGKSIFHTFQAGEVKKVIL